MVLLDVELLKEVDVGLTHDEPPDVLWHYTTVSAAIDIIQSRLIRLGCHAFMNDPGEGTVAGSIVSESWAAAVDSSRSHPRLDLSYVRAQSFERGTTCPVRGVINGSHPMDPTTCANSSSFSSVLMCAVNTSGESKVSNYEEPSNAETYSSDGIDLCKVSTDTPEPYTWLSVRLATAHPESGRDGVSAASPRA